MGCKSRSNYAIGQKVLESDWNKWFSKDIQENTKELEICDKCKSTFNSEYYSNGIQFCMSCRD